MSLILAVEPDRRQAAQLTGVIRQHVGAELILADTTEGALTAIGRRVPDLVLVPALLAPQDDAALASALRVIAAAAHVKTLTIPVFANGVRQPKPKKGVLAKLGLKNEEDEAPVGCEPSVFAEQVIAYLKEAAEERRAADERDVDDDPAYATPAYAAPADAVPASFESVSESFEEEAPAVYVEPVQRRDERVPTYVPYVPRVEPALSEVEVEEPAPLEVEGPALSEAEEPEQPAELVAVDAVETTQPEAEEPAAYAFAAEEAAETPIDQPVEAAPVETDSPEEEFAEEEAEEEEEDDQDIDLSDELGVFCDDEETNSEFDEESVAIYSLDMDPTFEVTAALEAMIDAPFAAAALEATVETTLEPGDDDTITELKAALDEPLPEPVDEWEDEADFDDEPDSHLWMPLSLGPFWPPMHVVAAPARPVVAATASAPAPAANVGAPAAAAGSGDGPKSEWVELIESLRLDIERLKSTPARKPAAVPVQAHPEAAAPSEPANKSKRKPAAVAVPGKKRQPVQDEWGFFDPEQCGFAALLAKLDEITEPEEAGPRPH